MSARTGNSREFPTPPPRKSCHPTFFASVRACVSTRAAYICAYTRQPSRRNSSYPARTVPLVCHARFAVERAARKRLGHPYEKFTPTAKELPLTFFASVRACVSTRAAYICAYTRQPSRRNSSCPARTVPLVCHARFAVERAARKRLGHPYESFNPTAKALPIAFFRARLRLRYTRAADTKKDT